MGTVDGSSASIDGEGGGLQEGDNFDGQGTSEFTNLQSVDTDSLVTKDGNEDTVRADAPTAYYDNNEFRYSQITTGSRMDSMPVRMVETDANFTHTNWDTISSPLVYGMISSPPGMVPVLKMWFHLQSQDSGQSAEIRVRAGIGTGSLYEFETGSGTGDNYVYDELYMNEYRHGTGDQADIPNHSLVVDGQVSGGTNGATLYNDSTFQLTYEAI